MIIQKNKHGNVMIKIVVCAVGAVIVVVIVRVVTEVEKK